MKIDLSIVEFTQGPPGYGHEGFFCRHQVQSCQKQHIFLCFSLEWFFLVGRKSVKVQTSPVRTRTPKVSRKSLDQFKWTINYTNSKKLTKLHMHGQSMLLMRKSFFRVYVLCLDNYMYISVIYKKYISIQIPYLSFQRCCCQWFL